MTDTATATNQAIFTLELNALTHALKQISGVVEQSQIMPILSHLKWSVCQDKVTLTSTDGSIFLTTHIPLQVACEHHVELALPCKKLLDICRTLPQNSSIQCHYHDQWFTMKTDQGEFTLATLDVVNFPACAIDPTQDKITIPADILHHVLSQTGFAMAQQDVRFFLNGVRFKITENTLSIAATDGHRLALCQHQDALKNPSDQTVILPRKAVNELIRLLNKPTDTIDMTLTQAHACFCSDTFTLTMSLLQGQYPEVQQLIPHHDAGQKATVDVAHFKQALQQVAILSHEKFRATELSFQANRLSISAHNAHQETAQHTLDIEYSGEPISMTFNISYLIEALSRLDEETTTLTLLTEQHCVYLEEAASLGHKQYVVMSLTL